MIVAYERRRGLVLDLATSLLGGKDAFLDFLKRNSTLKEDTDCWEWNHTKNSSGYGIIIDPRKTPCRITTPRAVLSRLVCETIHEMSKERHALHSCDNPPCVNPDHLRGGTPQDNSKDMVIRNRYADVKCENNPRAKLTRDGVREILSSKKWSPVKPFVDKFGISESLVRQIRAGKVWREAYEEFHGLTN